MKTFLSILVLTLGAGGLQAQSAGELQLIPADAPSPHSILPDMQYRMLEPGAPEPQNAAEFAEVFRSGIWREPVYTHQTFETGREIALLRFRIQSQTERHVYLRQRYSWIDSLTLYQLTPGGELRRTRGGDLIPYAERRPPHHLPVLALDLEAGEQQFLLYVESVSEKFLALQLTSPEDLYQTPSVYILILVLSASAVAALISLLIALVLRETLAWYYLAYLTAVAALSLVHEGYGHRYLYPHNPQWNDILLNVLIFVLLCAVLEFWRRLLWMPLQFPRLNRILQTFTYIMLACVPLYVLSPVDSLWDAFIVLAFGVSAALLLSAGFAAVRRGFTPAYLSVAGFAAFLLATLFYMFAGRPPLPGDEITANAPYLGYFAEFSLFLASIVARLRYLTGIAGERGTPPRPEASPAQRTTIGDGGETLKSRLPGNDVRSLSRRLIELLETEGLFADEDLSQERLAALLDLSRHQMSELFRVAYRANYHETVNRLRIEAACRLLRAEPERTVLSVAMAVGYSSKSVFNSAFRRFTGHSPSEYRDVQPSS